jgi:UDP:flavonoid glycosyltransferase YjiC (YdhE family)
MLEERIELDRPVILDQSTNRDSMRKIILTTIGTLGDLHPMIAIALALKARGFRPVLAVAEDHVAKVEAAALEAVSVLPSFDAIRRRMGLSEGDAVRKLMRDQRHMLEQVLLPELLSCVSRLDIVAADAAAIVSPNFVLAAPIVAEKRRLPFIAVMLQPMAMLSAYEPPRTPDFRLLNSKPGSEIGAVWNRMIYAAMRLALHRLYGRKLDAARTAHDLPRRGARRMFEPGQRAAGILGCYSPIFGPLPRDAPAHARITGFPVFDAPCAEAALDPELAAFLDAGPPPLVFTLGSFAVLAAGDFYAEASKVARRLGQRAVLLTGVEPAVAPSEEIFACAYAPHSALFPRASVTIHHGGVGTTGQALAAGKPQLVVPHMGDQNDNAHRVARLGVGRAYKGKFTARRATPIIASLLADERRRREAERIGALVAAEHGADAAAAAIEEVLRESARADQIRPEAT